MKKRIQIDYSKEKLITDQAAATELTMSSIVKKLEKGIMPNLAQGLIYTTDLGVRNLQDVVEKQNEITNLFYQLPTEIRNLMHNDISNFDAVITDPKNQETLSKYGLITQKRDEHTELLHAIQSLKPQDPPSDTPPKAQK